MIGIVGLGVVGAAVYHFFSQFITLGSIYDKFKGFPLVSQLWECDIVFLCLPTPTKYGKQDLSAIKDFFSLHAKKNQIYVIKSTVLPYHARELLEEFSDYKIIFNPEFLSSYKANEDMEKETNIILGGNPVYCNRVAMFYKQVNEDLQIFIMTAEEACMFKYIHNLFGATKVTFWNVMYDICERENIDLRKITKIFRGMKNFAKQYEQISADGKRGFGGACYPKDLSAFNKQYQNSFLNMVEIVNKDYRDYEKEFGGEL